MKIGFALIRARFNKIIQRLSFFPDFNLSFTEKDSDEIMRAPSYCNPGGYLAPAEPVEEKQ